MATAIPKLIPFLEGHPKGNTPEDAAELARALIILGPQEHKGRRYQAVSALDGQPVKDVPLDKQAAFQAEAVRIVVTNLPKPEPKPETEAK